MNPVEFGRWGFPALVIGFASFALLVPIVRVRVMHGVWLVRPLARQDPVHRAIASTVLAMFLWFTLLAAAAVGLGPESLAVWYPPAFLGWAGWGVAFAGLAIVVTAQTQMGRSLRMGFDEERTELVTEGLFRWIRNPIYTGMLTSLVGLAAGVPSPWTVSFLLTAFLLFVLVTRLEEAHLLRMHGDRYAAYAARVGRFVPNVGRLDPSFQSP